MKDVIIRNIERLLLQDEERERIEPMSEWKWRKLYQLTNKYELGPWVAEGLKAYESDFFLQMPAVLHQQFLELGTGEKNEEKLKRFHLFVERSQSPLHHFTKESLKAYADDLISNIKNIEE